MNELRAKMCYICNAKPSIKRSSTRYSENKTMRIKSILVLALVFTGFLKAQRHEIGLQLGGSNLVGDVGNTNLINPIPTKQGGFSSIPLHAAILYRLNFDPHRSLRFNVAYNNLAFDDDQATQKYRKFRGFHGNNRVYEADAIFEYNFFRVNEEQKSLLSPYIFVGIGGFMYKEKSFTVRHSFKNNGGQAKMPTAADDFDTTVEESSKNKISYSIPLGFGLKYKFNYLWAINAELMFRPTFTDNLDQSNNNDKKLTVIYDKRLLAEGTTATSLLFTKPYSDEAEKRALQVAYGRLAQVGNTATKDWYNTVSIGLTYSFGRPPCYCD